MLAFLAHSSLFWLALSPLRWTESMRSLFFPLGEIHMSLSSEMLIYKLDRTQLTFPSRDLCTFPENYKPRLVPYSEFPLLRRL